MTLELFVMWLLAGLVAGWLAGVMKGGGYGLIGDLALGLAGSLLGGWVFRTLVVAPGAGLFIAAVFAFFGAALVIGAQRMIWAHA